MIYSKNSNLFKHIFESKHGFYRKLNGLNLWNEELTSEIKHKVEKHWSQKLPTEKYDEKLSDKQKYYVLSMFPYPSGHLHMGHVRVYTISDTIARYQRMNGRNVIHPIGWDAFGLPAENAAIERNIAPDVWTKQNIEKMSEQLKQLGCSFEWDREIATCDPSYYKWTQELFLKLYDSGLVYRKEAQVNWDPVDKTVLADEQVDDNGLSWRSGAKVEKKYLRQWFVKTTKFAKDLLDGLDDGTLQDWRDIIKLQRHWIGECNGIVLDFELTEGGVLRVWNDRPEYYGDVSFIALTKNHLLVRNDGDDNKETRLTEFKAINPLNGEEIPVFVTSEIEFADGCDSCVGLPQLIEEHESFATKHKIARKPLRKLTEEQSKANVEDTIKLGGYYSSSKLKDWLISRQRYWGAPIPIIHCKNCGTQPVPRSQLPVELPKVAEVKKGHSALNECIEWLEIECPKCKSMGERETDTMDTFVDSSWYFLRYLDPKYDGEMFDVEKARKMTPIDLYIGGKEHAVLHLYYARFISHFLHSLGLLPEREPFKRLLVQGMVMGRSYRIKGSGQYLPQSKIKVVDKKKNRAVSIETGESVIMQWEKMSKSKHNGVDPSDMFQEYGIDTTRLLILADVAPTSHRNWNSNTFPGVLNWQRRLWLTINDFIKHRNEMPEITNKNEFITQEDYMYDSRNYYLKGATFNYCDSQQISVAISKLQGLTNSLRKVSAFVTARSKQFERALACQIILMAPMAPHFASELWSGFNSAPNRLDESEEILWDKGVLEQKWPTVDWEYKLDLVLLVNGFETSVIKIPRKDMEVLKSDEAINLALKNVEVQEYLRNNDKFVVDVKFVMHKGYQGVVQIIAGQNRKKIKDVN